jgi:hypothetical protein
MTVLIRMLLRDEDGSSVVEMLVAAGLTLTALGVLLGNVVVPLEHLARSHAADLPMVELRNAGEEVARLVRAARPGITEPAAAADGDRAVVLRVVEDGRVERVRIALVDDVLRIERLDAHGAALHGATRTLLTGLAPERAHLVLHLDGSGVDPVGPSVVAVGLRIEADGASLERVTALRMTTHLDGVSRW